jgi:6-phosphogluconate dehydrogenase
MQIAMVGLGRMGANMVRRLLRAGHECHVYDVSAEAVAELVAAGATGADSIKALAAYAEGLNVIGNAGVGARPPAADAETAPLREPRYYPYDDIDLAEVAEVWRRGSVVGSWLLDLTAEALHRDPRLEQFAGRVSDSGEGRWTSIAAIEEGVSAPLLTAALYSRFASRGSELFADKVESAQRFEFGGHREKTS